MIKETMTLTNSEGMHARPAGHFVKEAQRFQAAVEIEYQGKKKNGKSIMSLMGLGLKKGEPFDLIVDGADEADAMAALKNLIHTGL